MGSFNSFLDENPTSNPINTNNNPPSRNTKNLNNNNNTNNKNESILSSKSTSNLSPNPSSCDTNNKSPKSKKSVRPGKSLKRFTNSGRNKYVTNFTPLDFCDEISLILKIRIPFFNNKPLQALSIFTFLTGNAPYHEGLLIYTRFCNYYIAQSYPITFIKVKNFGHGILEIISFNNINRKSREYKISEVFEPLQPIAVLDLYDIINGLPNKYNIFNENCQDFVNNVIDKLMDKYRIKREDNSDKIKYYLFGLKDSNDKKNMNNNEGKNEINGNDGADYRDISINGESVFFQNIFKEILNNNDNRNSNNINNCFNNNKNNNFNHIDFGRNRNDNKKFNTVHEDEEDFDENEKNN